MQKSQAQCEEGLSHHKTQSKKRVFQSTQIMQTQVQKRGPRIEVQKTMFGRSNQVPQQRPQNQTLLRQSCTQRKTSLQKSCKGQRSIQTMQKKSLPLSLSRAKRPQRGVFESPKTQSSNQTSPLPKPFQHTNSPHKTNTSLNAGLSDPFSETPPGVCSTPDPTMLTHCLCSDFVGA